MKEKIVAFFKNKFNIALIVVQVVAIICYFLKVLSAFFAVIFLVLEGVFFILLGVRVLKSYNADTKVALISAMPLTDEEKQRQIKAISRSRKSNTIFAGMLMVLGVVLIFAVFSIF